MTSCTSISWEEKPPAALGGDGRKADSVAAHGACASHTPLWVPVWVLEGLGVLCARQGAVLILLPQPCAAQGSLFLDNGFGVSGALGVPVSR